METCPRQEAVSLSIELFAIIRALDGADALLQQLHNTTDAQKHDVVTILLHATRVAHAACETALTRVEPMYDADPDACDTAAAAEYAMCKAMVKSALEHASTVVLALEYASTQHADWGSLSSPPLPADVCSETCMREAIRAENVGAVALGIVILFELQSGSSVAIVPPRGLFVCALVECNNGPNKHILRLLLSSPALTENITDCDDDHNTVLMIAAMFGHVEAITVLLACPAVAASAGAKNNVGDTALIIASRFGFADTVRALLACHVVVASSGTVDFFKHTALAIAIASTNMQLIGVLLACPAVVSLACNVIDDRGETVLMIASTQSSAETINALLACPTAAASAGAKNNYHHTALMIAAQHGRAEIIEALLACPTVAASAGETDYCGETALMMGAMFGDRKTIHALLACPTVAASAGATNNNGDTALMVAAIHGNAEAIHALLACPTVAASAGAVGNHGNTALDRARTFHRTQAITALLSCSTVLDAMSSPQLTTPTHRHH